MFYGIDFSGLADPKPKKEQPKVPPPLPPPPVPQNTWLPKWLPAAVGAAGMGVVIMLLITSKGKE